MSCYVTSRYVTFTLCNLTLCSCTVPAILPQHLCLQLFCPLSCISCHVLIVLSYMPCPRCLLLIIIYWTDSLRGSKWEGVSSREEWRKRGNEHVEEICVWKLQEIFLQEVFRTTDTSAWASLNNYILWYNPLLYGLKYIVRTFSFVINTVYNCLILLDPDQRNWFCISLSCLWL